MFLVYLEPLTSAIFRLRGSYNCIAPSVYHNCSHPFSPCRCVDPSCCLVFFSCSSDNLVMAVKHYLLPVFCATCPVTEHLLTFTHTLTSSSFLLDVDTKHRHLIKKLSSFLDTCQGVYVQPLGLTFTHVPCFTSLYYHRLIKSNI